MRRRVNIWQSIDWLTIVLYSILVLFGWLNIYAAVYNEEHHSIFDVSQRYGKQLIWIGATVIIAIIILLLDDEFYIFFAYVIYAIVILLLLGVLIIGTEVHGAKSWFGIGEFRIQPSEFAKFATSLAIAKYLSSYNMKIMRFSTLLIVSLLLLLPMGLILLQPDTGSAIVYAAFLIVLYREGLSGGFLLLTVWIVFIFFITLLYNNLNIFIFLLSLFFITFWLFNQNFKRTLYSILLFLGILSLLYGVNWFLKLNINIYYQMFSAFLVSSIFFLFWAYKYRMRYVFWMVPVLIGSVIFTYSVNYVFNNILEKHQQQRINVVLGLESDPLGVEYNINQSKIAIGSGGFFGKGFLQGTQTKYEFVPEQSTDFIFCTIGEEWGFLGSSIIIIFFMILILRIIFLAERQKIVFSRIYGYCVASILFFHILINIGMTIGLAPVIGIPLPFFSYGGSSLWGFTVLIFIFIRLDARRPELLGK